MYTLYVYTTIAIQIARTAHHMKSLISHHVTSPISHHVTHHVTSVTHTHVSPYVVRSGVNVYTSALNRIGRYSQT